MNTKSVFFQRSKIIVENFLQSVLIVDDLAFGKTASSDEPTELAEPLAIPGSTPTIETDIESKDSGGEDNIISTPINAKAIINSFADHGIACTVFEPEKDQLKELDHRLLKLATKFDVIILDWYIHKNNGAHAINLIEYLIKQNQESTSQLRLITIYTTASDQVPQIADRILAKINELKNQQEPEISDSNLSISFEGMHIEIFLKQDNTFENFKDRQIENLQLADTIIEEFTKLTAGLVSNSLLYSFTKIRENTYKMLKKFSHELDAPYLTHRVLIPNPEESESLLSSLISQEIENILKESKTGSSAGIDAITVWLEQETTYPSFHIHNNLEIDTTPKYIGLMNNGLLKTIENSDLLPTQKKNLKTKSLANNLTQSLNRGRNEQNVLDSKFAELTLLRTFYGNIKPLLTLGTILLKKITRDDITTTEYFLCIQPRCDTVRVKNNQAFLFIKLNEVTAGDQPFNMIIKMNDNYIRLKVKTDTKNLNLLNFDCNTNDRGLVESENKQGQTGYFFTDTSSMQYEWVGELQFTQAQRWAQTITSHLSRVGIDESEWLRLSAS